MFADENFDPDKEFLNDLTQKNTLYSSQDCNSNEENRVKRLKLDDNSSGPSPSTISDIVEPVNSNFGRDRLVTNVNDFSGDKSDRKKLILERLKRRQNTDSVPSTHENTNKTNSNTLSSNPGTSRLAPDPETRNLQSFKRNSNESLAASTRSFDIKSCPILTKNVDSSNSKPDVCNTSRNSPYKPAKAFTKPVTLFREFPGPAGLLPNSSRRISPPVSLNSSCKDYNTDGVDIDVDKKSFDISKYCSQNTTNSFMDSPWQSLMNDVGDDFLCGHEISRIKRKAGGNLYKNDTVPYLAGKVQRVDSNLHAPVIVLKDYTGTIQATICKDVFIEHPELLDVGNVWFLRNVGLLTTGDTVKNTHVIIALKNIVNVYTTASKLFSNLEMEARLENFIDTDCHLNESAQNRDSNMKQRPNIDCSKQTHNTQPPSRPSNLTVSQTSTACGRRNLFTDNHENPISPQAVINSSRSTIPKSNKFTFESEEFKDFDDDLDYLFSGIDDDMASKTSTDIDSAKSIKTGESSCVSMNRNTTISEQYTVLNTVHLNTRLSEGTEQSIPKVTSVNIEKEKEVQVKVSVSTMKNCNLPKTSNITLKLSALRGTAELTPPTSQELDLATTEDIHKQNEAEDKSRSISVLPLNKEIDSDEEFFSQVDVESVLSRYDSQDV